MTEQNLPSRLKGWEARLADTIGSHAAMPFAWGRADCLCLVGDVAVALVGEDPMAAFRGRYRTALGAKRLLHRQGYADVAAALAGRFEEIAPAMARRGDCGLVGDDELATVIVTGAEVVGKSAATTGGIGLAVLSRDRMVRAFRIGW